VNISPEGYPRNTSAEACAEAASALDRAVPLSSLLLRRFRSEFIEPLLQKDENWCPAGTKAKSRLACAVKQMQRAKGGDENENRRLLVELAVALRTVGIPANQRLRKKLDKWVHDATL
jgi:hypothetical protein